LHAIRKNLGGSYVLMNDLDSTTAGYEDLASPTANGGEGWQPLLACRFWTGACYGFSGTFDGQGYEIHDLFVNRPSEQMGVGLFGWVDAGAVIKNIGVVNVTMTGTVNVGGLAGANWGGNVNDSYSTGSVTGAEGVGGLVGNNGGTVSNCYATARVTGRDVVGGLIGDNPGTVSNSYSTGSVTGSEGLVGGLVGQNVEGTVSNSYSTGTVIGEGLVGGLVGQNAGGTVSNSYSTGNVTGGGLAGGLVGQSGEGTATGSFWDIQTSGQALSVDGTGKTTAEMQDITTFSAAGWNITDVAPGQTNPAYIWNIVDNVTYPFLSWQSVS